MTSRHLFVSLTLVVATLAIASQAAAEQKRRENRPLVFFATCEEDEPCRYEIVRVSRLEPDERQRQEAADAIFAAAGLEDTTCTWQGTGVGSTLVCLDVRAEGTCACVFTTTGHHCIGSNPVCSGI